MLKEKLEKPNTRIQSAYDAEDKAAFVLRLQRAIEATAPTCEDPKSRASLQDMASLCKKARKEYKECLERSESGMEVLDKLGVLLAFVERKLFGELQPDGAEVVDTWLFIPETLRKPECQVTADEIAFFVLQLHKVIEVTAASGEHTSMKRELLGASGHAREAFNAYKAIRDSSQAPTEEHARVTCLKELALVESSLYKVLQEDGETVVNAWLPWPTKLQFPEKQAGFKDKVFFLRHLQKSFEDEIDREMRKPDAEQREVRRKNLHLEAQGIARALEAYATAEGSDKEDARTELLKLYGIKSQIDRGCLEEQRQSGARIADAWLFSQKTLTYPFHKATSKEKGYFLRQFRMALLASAQKVDNENESQAMRLHEVANRVGEVNGQCTEGRKDDDVPVRLSTTTMPAKDASLAAFAKEMVNVNPSLFNLLCKKGARKVQAWLFDAFASTLQKPQKKVKTEDKLHFLLQVMAAADRLEREKKFKGGKNLDDIYKYQKIFQKAADAHDQYWSRIFDVKKAKSADQVFEEYFTEMKKATKEKEKELDDTAFDISVFDELQADGAKVFKAWQKELTKGKVSRVISAGSCTQS